MHITICAPYLMGPPREQLARDETNSSVVLEPLEQRGRGLLLPVQIRPERVDGVAAEGAVAERLAVGKFPVHQGQVLLALDQAVANHVTRSPGGSRALIRLRSWMIDGIIN